MARRNSTAVSNPRAYQTKPRPAKNQLSRIPAPQSARILQRFIAGQSIRQISRAEARARETVTKIVRCDEVQDYVRRLKEQFFGLGSDALEAVRHSLEQNDGRLGYRLLIDIGVVPPQAERDALSARRPMTDQEEEAAVQALTEKVVRLQIIRQRAFNLPLPWAEQLESEEAAESEKRLPLLEGKDNNE